MSEPNELISFIASMTGEGNLRVEENLGEGFVRLRVAEAERRQAKHDIQHVEDIVTEMLRNARDAHATVMYVATTKEGSTRTLLFLDNGCGVPSDMHERIFDARVTSKLESMKMDRWGVHGRGMALYSMPSKRRSFPRHLDWARHSVLSSIPIAFQSEPINRPGRSLPATRTMYGCARKGLTTSFARRVSSPLKSSVAAKCISVALQR